MVNKHFIFSCKVRTGLLEQCVIVFFKEYQKEQPRLGQSFCRGEVGIQWLSTKFHPIWQVWLVLSGLIEIPRGYVEVRSTEQEGIPGVAVAFYTTPFHDVFLCSFIAFLNPDSKDTSQESLCLQVSNWTSTTQKIFIDGLEAVERVHLLPAGLWDWKHQVKLGEPSPPGLFLWVSFGTLPSFSYFA